MKKNERMWELRQSADDPARLDLWIYGDVEGDGYDWRSGEVIRSETSANAFREALAAHPDAKEIHLYINSYGGSVFEGTAIYNQLRRHPAQKIVHVDGFACSITSVIAMAGDRVIMPRNTLMMIHNAWMVAVGNAAELRKATDDLDTINTAGMQAYMQKAREKLDPDRLREMMDAETWLTAQECVELGLADELEEQDADLTKAAGILQKVNRSLSQRVEEHRSIAAQLREIRREERDGRDHLISQRPADFAGGRLSTGQSADSPATPQGEAMTVRDAPATPQGEAMTEPAREEPKVRNRLLATLAGQAE